MGQEQPGSAARVTLESQGVAGTALAGLTRQAIGVMVYNPAQDNVRS